MGKVKKIKGKGIKKWIWNGLKWVLANPKTVAAVAGAAGAAGGAYYIHQNGGTKKVLVDAALNALDPIKIDPKDNKSVGTPFSNQERKNKYAKLDLIANGYNQPEYADIPDTPPLVARSARRGGTRGDLGFGIRGGKLGRHFTTYDSLLQGKSSAMKKRKLSHLVHCARCSSSSHGKGVINHLIRASVK